MNDVVTKGRYRGLRFPKRQIRCGRGNSRMRCADCASFDFEIHVRPIIIAPASGKQVLARVMELICLGCLKVRKLDDKGVIQATGKIESTRLIDSDFVAPDPTDIRAKQVRKDNGA